MEVWSESSGVSAIFARIGDGVEGLRQELMLPQPPGGKRDSIDHPIGTEKTPVEGDLHPPDPLQVQPLVALQVEVDLP
ncbi:hypothetical protein JCM17961_43980 [Endothiovibrio diazotrophicus]